MTPNDPQPDIEILNQIFSPVLKPEPTTTDEILEIYITTNVRPSYARVACALETFEKFGPQILSHVALGVFKLTGIAYNPDSPDSPESDVPRD